MASFYHSETNLRYWPLGGHTLFTSLCYEIINYFPIGNAWELGSCQTKETKDNSLHGTPMLQKQRIGHYYSSVQFSHSVVSDSFRPHELQHTRPLCPSPTPGIYSNSCPSSRWCHPAISFSVVPFSSCPQSLPASGSFPMSQLFAWGSQSTGVSASASVLPMNTQDWSPLGWTGWISLQSKGLSRVFSNTTVQSINSLALSFLHSPTLTSIHDHWKNHNLD